MTPIQRILGIVGPNEQTDRFGYTTFEYTMAAIVLSLFVGLIVYLWIRDSKNTWDDGIIPTNFKPTTSNIFEIYIAAGCAIALRDPKRLRGKFAVISRLLRKSFPKEFYDFSDSYEFSLGTPVKIDSLSEWCNKHLADERKIDLLNFLAEIAVSDDNIEDQEKQYLYVLAQKMNISTSNLRQELFDSLYEEPKVQERVYTTIDLRAKYFTILGLSPDASAIDIKRSYKALVKITHPDRFMNESLEVQEEMKRKFQEIQEAYEKLSEDN